MFDGGSLSSSLMSKTSESGQWKCQNIDDDDDDEKLHAYTVL